MISSISVVAGERSPAHPIVLAQQRPQLQPALPPDLMPRTHGRRGRSSGALDPLGPPPLPPDPMQKQDDAIRRALSDPALRAGLPPNAKLTPPPETAPSTTTLPDRFQPLDRDRDGRITRDEYMRGRDRIPPASFATDTRQQIMRQRLDSQFRQADHNRDGAITPDELQDNVSPRF
jgi:hypothetical protein